LGILEGVDVLFGLTQPDIEAGEVPGNGSIDQAVWSHIAAMHGQPVLRGLGGNTNVGKIS